MPFKDATAKLQFTVEFTAGADACPEGSECMNALRCVEMGGRCVEGTAGCGGRAQNCCCTFRKPFAERVLPVLTAVGAIAFIAVGIAYGLRKLGRSRR
jgi:hypothetical protein